MIPENQRTLQHKDLFHRQLVTFGRFVPTSFLISICISSFHPSSFPNHQFWFWSSAPLPPSSFPLSLTPSLSHSHPILFLSSKPLLFFFLLPSFTQSTQVFLLLRFVVLSFSSEVRTLRSFFILLLFPSNMYLKEEAVVTSVVNPITRPNVVVFSSSSSSSSSSSFSLTPLPPSLVPSSSSDGLGTRIKNYCHVDSMHGIRQLTLLPLLAGRRFKSSWKLRSSPCFRAHLVWRLHGSILVPQKHGHEWDKDSDSVPLPFLAWKDGSGECQVIPRFPKVNVCHFFLLYLI